MRGSMRKNLGAQLLEKISTRCGPAPSRASSRARRRAQETCANRTNRIKLRCPIIILLVHGSLNGRTLPREGIVQYLFYYSIY